MRLRAYSYYNQTPTEIFDDAEQTLQQLRIISTTTLLVETREPHEALSRYPLISVSPYHLTFL